jgi:hypothetical protein
MSMPGMLVILVLRITYEMELYTSKSASAFFISPARRRLARLAACYCRLRPPTPRAAPFNPLLVFFFLSLLCFLSFFHGFAVVKMFVKLQVGSLFYSSIKNIQKISTS